MVESIVTCKDLSKEYQLGKTTIKALKNVTLEIPGGAFIAVTGPSGSGKSTLLNLIGALDNPTSGKIFISGEDLDQLNDKKLSILRGKKIGFIFQSFNLIPVLSVYENVEYPLLLTRQAITPEIKQKILDLIEKVGLIDKLKHKPNELSGGQRQRVSIARALITEPSIVLADEPTANLDFNTGMEILELMKDMNANSKTTFIFSTHDSDVMALAQKKYKLRDGELR